MRAGLSLSAAAVWAFLPALAAARETPVLEDIVITATRYERPLSDLPARVTVLTAADLRRLSADKLDEALAHVAGVAQLRNNGAYSYKATVSLRGTSTSQGGRTLILVDGVPVNTGATGDVNWNRIPLELVERVEVFKGPGSSLYGGDALGGVIHIITRRPKRKVEALAVLEGASYGTDNQRLMAAVRSSGTFGGLYLRSYGLHGHSDGYNSTPVFLRNPYTSYINRYYQEHGASALAGYTWEGGRLELEYTSYDDLRGEGTRVKSKDGANRAYGLDTFRASGEGRLGDTDWRLLAYKQRTLYRRLNESQSSATNYSRTDTVVDRRDYSLWGSFSRLLPFAHKLSLGAEFKAGRVDGVDRQQTTPFASVNDAGKMDTFAVFLQDDWSLGEGRPTVLAGLRYDGAHFYDGFFNNPAYSNLSGPMAAQDWRAMTWRLSARQRLADSLSAYLSYSRGFRQPSVEDMVLTMVRVSGVNQKYYVGNSDLGPERLDNYELGADYSPLEGLKLSPSLYYSRGWDFIYNVNTGRTDAATGKPIYQYQNVAAVDIHGAEAEARYSAGPAALWASYGFSRSTIRNCRQNPALNGNDLAGAPRQTAAASAAWRFPWLEASASWRYKGAQYYDEANLQGVLGYQTLAFKAWRRLGRGFAVSADLENALDERFQESSTDLAPGRTVKGALTWEF